MTVVYENYLAHHGVKGQKWGVRKQARQVTRLAKKTVKDGLKEYDKVGNRALWKNGRRPSYNDRTRVRYLNLELKKNAVGYLQGKAGKKLNNPVLIKRGEKQKAYEEKKLRKHERLLANGGRKGAKYHKHLERFADTMSRYKGQTDARSMKIAAYNMYTTEQRAKAIAIMNGIISAGIRVTIM